MIAEMPEFEIKDRVLVCYKGSEKTVVVPEGVTEIGFRSFCDCGFLEEVEIPGSVRAIAAYAFMRCGNLKSVTLHEGLQEIGMWAFGDCNDLESITIPDTVMEIGQYALGFRQASYQERYVQGKYHSFNSGFHIHHNDNAAAIKYIAFHKLSLRMVRS